MAEFVEELDRLENTELQESIPGTPTPVTVIPKKVKEEVRDIETLYNLLMNDPKKVKGLTDREKNDFITAMLQEITRLNVECDEVKRNAQGAYEQLRILGQNYENVRTDAMTRLNFVKQQVKTCFDAVNLLSTLKETK